MEKTKVTRIVKYTVLAAIGMLIVGVIISCVVVGINRGNLPEVVVEHNGQSANIDFAGYTVSLGVASGGGATILPLSDGSYLVGMRFFKGIDSNGLGTDPYLAFFLFDKDWNYISDVPFDDEGFLSGEEALSMYESMRDDRSGAPDENPMSVKRSTFETNGLSYQPDGRTDAYGRLGEWHTNSGIIRQEIADSGYDEERFLFKYYYYDFTSHSVKLASVPELDGYLPKAGYVLADGDYDTQLLYGYFIDGPGLRYQRRSFAILLKGEEVLWQKSRVVSDTEYSTYRFESGITPKAWSSKDKYLVAWPAWTGANDWQFSIVFSDGREVAFPSVSLPAEIELDSVQRCNFDEEAVRLDFLFGDDQWISIDHDGNIGKAEPFEIDVSHETFDFQFFVSIFSLSDNPNNNDSPGADLYRRRYTTVFDRWFELGDYKDARRYRGACLEVVYNPTETNYNPTESSYVEPKDAPYCIFGQ